MGKEKEDCYFREKVNKTEKCDTMKCNVMKGALDNFLR